MNTLRTDVARWRLVCRFDQGGEYDANPKRDNEGEWVSVDVYTQLETELAAMTALAERLAQALEACQEDSKELLAEHSWWINEPRCGYAGRYLKNKKRIAEAQEALAAYVFHNKHHDA